MDLLLPKLGNVFPVLFVEVKFREFNRRLVLQNKGLSNDRRLKGNSIMWENRMVKMVKTIHSEKYIKKYRLPYTVYFSIPFKCSNALSRGSTDIANFVKKSVDK